MIHPHRTAHGLAWAATCDTPGCRSRLIPTLPARDAAQMATEAETQGWLTRHPREGVEAACGALCPSCVQTHPPCPICHAINHPAPGHRWYGQRAHYPPASPTRVRSTRVLAWPDPTPDAPRRTSFATTSHTPGRAAIAQLAAAALDWDAHHGPGRIAEGTAPCGHPHLHYTPA